MKSWRTTQERTGFDSLPKSLGLCQLAVDWTAAVTKEDDGRAKLSNEYDNGRHNTDDRLYIMIPLASLWWKPARRRTKVVASCVRPLQDYAGAQVCALPVLVSLRTLRAWLHFYFFLLFQIIIQISNQMPVKIFLICFLFVPSSQHRRHSIRDRHHPGGHLAINLLVLRNHSSPWMPLPSRRWLSHHDGRVTIPTFIELRAQPQLLCGILLAPPDDIVRSQRSEFGHILHRESRRFGRWWLSMEQIPAEEESPNIVATNTVFPSLSEFWDHKGSRPVDHIYNKSILFGSNPLIIGTMMNERMKNNRTL